MSSALVQPNADLFRAADAQHIASVTDSVYPRIKPFIERTPLQQSMHLSKEDGASVWFKMDHLQLTGSFKLRGASSILQFMSKEERDRGVVTASTGNHGLGTALAASRLGCSPHIYLPQNASPSKIEAIKQLGAQIHFVKSDDCFEAEMTAKNTAKEQGLTFISPYNDPRIIAGQGTIALEILAQCQEAAEAAPDAVFVSVGGGGLIAGVAAYLKSKLPNVEIVGCQPYASRVMYESSKVGKVLMDVPELPTLSDGTAGGIEEDTVTFPICCKHVDKYVICQEGEIAQAMRHCAEHERMIVEGSAALCVASFMKTREQYQGKKVVIVLCGRNITMTKFMKVMGQQEW